MADEKEILEETLARVEKAAPEPAIPVVRRLRRPDARGLRGSVGALLVVGGLLSFLPVLGIWMLPLGLFLIAYDVPVLRRPAARLALEVTRRWRRRRRRRRRAGGAR